MSKILIIIPTYNEVNSIFLTLKKIHLYLPKADILVVDDNSPDCTGKLVEKFYFYNPKVNVLNRRYKDGLGKAYIEGFHWGLKSNRLYDIFIEMDADGSHQPKYLPYFIKKIHSKNIDIILGSRWVKGGGTLKWPISRIFLSKISNIYSRLVLGLQIKDLTGGYRVYKRYILEKLNFNKIHSKGYCFQIDILLNLINLDFKVKELPIIFLGRKKGKSKINKTILLEAFIRITILGIRLRIKNILKKLKKIKNLFKYR